MQSGALRFRLTLACRAASAWRTGPPPNPEPCGLSAVGGGGCGHALPLSVGNAGASPGRPHWKSSAQLAPVSV